MGSASQPDCYPLRSDSRVSLLVPRARDCQVAPVAQQEYNAGLKPRMRTMRAERFAPGGPTVMNFFEWLDKLFAPSHSFHGNEHKYISPTYHGHKSGWRKVYHPAGWVRHALLEAPDYSPQQGVHFFPYCRGRHFEYLYDGESVYSRRFHRNPHQH